MLMDLLCHRQQLLLGHFRVKRIQRTTIADVPLPAQLAFAIHFTDRLAYDLTKFKFGTPVLCSRTTYPIMFTQYKPSGTPLGCHQIN